MIRVLQSVGQVSDRDNPYMSLLVEALPYDIESRYYTKWRALFGRYEVLHVHWPDHLLRDPSSLKTRAKQVVFALMLFRLAVLRTPVVRTVHNRVPHEASQSRVERFLLDRLDRMTSFSFLLNPFTEPIGSSRSVVSRHGHYRTWFARYEPERSQPRSLLFFGLIRAYKNVPLLLDAFERLETPDAQLAIMGSCSDPDLRSVIEAKAGRDTRVSCALRHASDEELVHAISSSSLVVLPYAEMHNSGALILALSLNRPVLVPKSEVTDDLAHEVGEEWVHRYEDTLTPSDLEDAMASAAQADDAPDLTLREWHEVAGLVGDGYRTALVERKR